MGAVPDADADLNKLFYMRFYCTPVPLYAPLPLPLMDYFLHRPHSARGLGRCLVGHTEGEGVKGLHEKLLSVPCNSICSLNSILRESYMHTYIFIYILAMISAYLSCLPV